MQSRRDFIKQASMMVAGGIVVPDLLSSCGNKSQGGKYLGLQLYSLRDMIRDEGIQKTLTIVSEMGYNSLETASYNDGKFYGETPENLKKMVEDLGMKLTASHLGRNITGDHDADMAWWNKAVEAHNAAGMKYMVMPSSPLRDEGATLDNIKRYGNYFNEIGLISAGASVQFGYHNHAFEFENKVDGVPVYDLMLENTSPDHVLFELDVYWIKIGGYDPVDYMKKYPKRIKILHIKDETAIGAQNTVDYKAVFDQAYVNGIKDWYVEVERYDGTPQEDVQKSADFLRKADFVK
ncbi:MAG: sugar phosphate isomerase/epimerase [Tannerella sp.]|jgi:sugar phosphate isomerase/epimerase|nr:sugar phosphate isomerase/epimerase [Tannerella sp.]